MPPCCPALPSVGRNVTVIRIELNIALSYEVDAPGADFLFNIHAAYTPCQLVGAESLQVDPPLQFQMHTHPLTGNRCMRLHAPPGPLRLDYRATVDLNHYVEDPARIPEVEVAALPPEVIDYLYPSRYCQSDRLLNLAASEFGGLSRGYARVAAIRDWVQRHVAFTPNTSNSNTSAIDTLVNRMGVCRDFAHLMIALCRASNVPARFVTGTDFGADPSLGPPDFHAYVEAFLGGRWYIFDPSGTAIPMGFVRIGTGRDAADVAFATIFGSFRSPAPYIHTTAVSAPEQNLVAPRLCAEALSTDDGVCWPPAAR